MKKLITLTIFISFFLNGCISIDEVKQKTRNSNDISINYYSDKSVNSLEIPPDLTRPSYEKSFRLEDLGSKSTVNLVNLSDNIIEDNQMPVLKIPTEISVKKSGDRRWLVVSKSSDTVWNLARQFIKEQGLRIKEQNKLTGIIETDYSENKAVLPDESLNVIRAMFQKALQARYSLPTIDKFRFRIEPLGNDKTQVFLSMSSMREVVTDSGKDHQNTIWQDTDKDRIIETEMLYRLMVFLGGEKAKAREKIIEAIDESKVVVNILKGIKGYTKLRFNLNSQDTWDNVSWALDELNVEIEDKDYKEKSFYIRVARTADKGIFSSVFGDDAIRNTYQLIVRSVENNKSELLFNDLTELNEKETILFSDDFMKLIANKF